MRFFHGAWQFISVQTLTQGTYVPLEAKYSASFIRGYPYMNDRENRGEMEKEKERKRE